MNPAGWSLRQLLTRLFAFSGMVVVAAVVTGAISVTRLDDQNQALVGRVDPAEQLVSQMFAGYLDQETGVRGYVLTGQTLFLQPYRSGRSTVSAADARLGRLIARDGPTAGLLGRVRQEARSWEQQFAGPAVAAVGRGDRSFTGGPELTAGKNLFDALRRSISALQQKLAAERRAAQARATRALDQLIGVLIISIAVIVADGVVIWVALRKLVLGPLAAVGGDARTVTSGDLSHPVRPAGPRETSQLASDIEAMRQKIFAEVTEAREAREQLAATNADLARSNEDLEQFAYVASHDLQEPLRKVTSFCQLLEQRYGGQLDERADQYIGFAVDGAKRMQVLINDLLAFSRIGRTTDTFEPVPLAECVTTATRNLASTIDETGALVSVEGDLPTVSGDPTLLAGLMQNLIGNAIKFRADRPPEVAVTAGLDGDEWTVSVADNGIGIDARYAERIFVIFQRLHGRDSYAGTGIGLALCRKIVEFHGGRIWLDVDHHPGTRFCFTLPQARSEEDTDELDPAAVEAG